MIASWQKALTTVLSGWNGLTRHGGPGDGRSKWDGCEGGDGSWGCGST